jgi:restriction endonuclease S subunit
MKKLGEITDIQFGLYEKSLDKGNVKYLLAGHFNSSFQPTKFEDSYIDLEDKSGRFLLEPNDVILSGKGQRIFAWAYDSSFGAAVASSIFYMLRPDSNIILGDYLAYYLNSNKVQFQLQSIGAGATITSIPKRELEQIEIVIPTMDEQIKLVRLAKLLERDIALSEEIIEKKNTLKSALINKMINNNIKLNMGHKKKS